MRSKKREPLLYILFALWVCGCAAVVYGISLWSEPLGWVIGGLALAITSNIAWSAIKKVIVEEPS